MTTSRSIGRDPRADDRTRAVIASLLGSGGKKSPSYFLDLADRIESLLDVTRTGGEIAGYRLVRLLGHGNSGVVYLGEREGHLEEPGVAVKLLIPGRADEAARSRFLREGEALLGLRHPGIVRMMDRGVTEDGISYLVRERVDGVRIDRFCDHHRLTVAERLRLVLQLCDAVAYAHRQGVAHGDLKPGNVLVEREGIVRLIDFSSAALLPQGGPSSRGAPAELTTRFTPGYASPEQLRGRQPARPADIYAMGVLLYELLTGQLPRHRKARKTRSGASPGPGVMSMELGIACQRREDPASAREAAHRRSTTVPKLRRRLRGGLEDAVQRALHSEPGRRYQQIEELAEDIARQVEPKGDAADVIRRHPLAAGLVGAGVAAVAVGGLLASRGE